MTKGIDGDRTTYLQRVKSVFTLYTMPQSDNHRFTSSSVAQWVVLSIQFNSIGDVITEIRFPCYKVHKTATGALFYEPDSTG